MSRLGQMLNAVALQPIRSSQDALWSFRCDTGGSACLPVCHSVSAGQHAQTFCRPCSPVSETMQHSQGRRKAVAACKQVSARKENHPVGWAFRLCQQQVPQSRSPVSSTLHQVDLRPRIPCENLERFHCIDCAYGTPACRRKRPYSHVNTTSPAVAPTNDNPGQDTIGDMGNAQGSTSWHCNAGPCFLEPCAPARRSRTVTGDRQLHMLQKQGAGSGKLWLQHGSGQQLLGQCPQGMLGSVLHEEVQHGQHQLLVLHMLIKM